MPDMTNILFITMFITEMLPTTVQGGEATEKLERKRSSLVGKEGRVSQYRPTP